ncbi:MAG: DUF2066 domain-containing protein [Magnetovibrionaceae bacterium]
MIHVFSLRPFSGLLSLCLALCALFSPGNASPARAQVLDPFTVQGIVVDETADTAVAARESAIRAGERAAFNALLSRITLAEDRFSLPRLSDQEVAGFINDMTVAAEKTSSVRYIGRLDFRFRPDDIRAFLSAYGIPFAETVSRPLLVLPVLETGGKRVLFGDANIWADAWAASGLSAGLVPVQIPLGDLADMGLMNVDRALRREAVNFATMAERYGAEDTLVAIARLDQEAVRATPELTVETRRFGPSGAPVEQSRRYPAADGETAEDLLNRAASEIAAELGETWKQANLIDASREAFIPVVVPLQSLGDWLDVKQRLDSVTLIRDLQLILLARDRARVNLLYAGSEDQLRLALDQAGLVIYRSGFDQVIDRPGRPRYQGQTLVNAPSDPAAPVPNQTWGPNDQRAPQAGPQVDPRGGEFLSPLPVPPDSQPVGSQPQAAPATGR